MSAPALKELVIGRDTCEWSRLTEGVIQEIASYLHPSEVAINFKLVNRETARFLRHFRRIQLSQPLTQGTKEPVQVAVPFWPSTGFVAHWGRPQPWRALSLRQRCGLLCLAANSGCAASLEVALAHCGCSLTSEVAVAAALGGSVSACETLLIREGCDSMARLEDVAAEAGRLELLRWLRQARREELLSTPPPQLLPERMPDELTTAVAACRGGHAHILAWLQQEEEQAQGLGGVPGAVAAEPLTLAHPKAVPFLAGAAAGGGHVQLLDQLLPRLEPIPTGAACSMLEQVAQGCPLEALQRAYNHVFEVDVHPNGSTKQTLAIAAAVSNTPDWEQKLDWVLQQQPNRPLPANPVGPGDDFFKDVDMLICGAGRLPDWLQRLQALHACNVPLPPLSGLAEHAAAAGDVAALTWLLAEQGEGVPVSADLARVAAAAGHVPVLTALQERGCVFSEDDVLTAAQAGRTAAVSWLLAQPLPQDLSVGDWAAVFKGLARQGADLATLRQLHERHGAPIDLEAVARHGSVEALEWAMAALRGPGAGRRGAQQAVERQLCCELQNRKVWYTAEAGNLAAADWLTQLLVMNGFRQGPTLPAVAVIAATQVVGCHSFGALRWWLRQRQEGHGVGQSEQEEGQGQEGQGQGQEQLEGQEGALTDTEWRKLLECVASSVFTAPAYLGEYKYSRAQWNWLMAKRLEAAAAQEKKAGQEGAVAAARAEAGELAAAAAAAQPYVFPGLPEEFLAQLAADQMAAEAAALALGAAAEPGIAAAQADG